MISELGQNQPGILSYIRFLFAYKSISLRPVIVKAHKPEINGKKLCAHGKTTRRATLGETDVPNWTFVIIVLSLHPSGAIV
jgi:hypothetical protein